MVPADALIFAAVVAVLVFWAIGAHNRVTALRNSVHAAWPAVDELLQQRGTTLGALAEALHAQLAAQPAGMDASVVGALQAALGQVRSAAAVVRQHPSGRDAMAGLAVAEAALEPVLARVQEGIARDPALVDVPELIAPQRDLELQAPRLDIARQAFNQAVRAYNDAVGQFPTKLLMPLLRFAKAGGF